MGITATCALGECVGVPKDPKEPGHRVASSEMLNWEFHGISWNFIVSKLMSPWLLWPRFQLKQNEFHHEMLRRKTLVLACFVFSGGLTEHKELILQCCCLSISVLPWLRSFYGYHLRQTLNAKSFRIQTSGVPVVRRLIVEGIPSRNQTVLGNHLRRVLKGYGWITASICVFFCPCKQTSNKHIPIADPNFKSTNPAQVGKKEGYWFSGHCQDYQRVIGLFQLRQCW